MAQEHNALKYNPQLARLGERGFGIDDNEQSITRMSETLQGIVDLWSQPEFAVYRGENVFARKITIPAVAARNSIVSLIATDPTLIVKVLAWSSSSTSQTIEAQIGTGGSVAANPVVSGGVPLDARLGSVGEISTTTLVSGDVAAGVALPQWSQRTTTAGNQLVAVTPWILVPGFKVDWINATVNEAFVFQLVFSERKAFPGELKR